MHATSLSMQIPIFRCIRRTMNINTMVCQRRICIGSEYQSIHRLTFTMRKRHIQPLPMKINTIQMSTKTFTMQPQARWAKTRRVTAPKIPRTIPVSARVSHTQHTRTTYFTRYQIGLNCLKTFNFLATILKL